MNAHELVLTQFPGKVLLELVVAGKAIGLEEQTCYNLNCRRKFPLPVRHVGRKPMVAVHDLVNYLLGAAPESPNPQVPKPVKRGRGRPRNDS